MSRYNEIDLLLKQKTITIWQPEFKLFIISTLTMAIKGKIIGVGFQKTGTSTLRDALRGLGYTVGDTRYKLLIPILKNDFNTVLKEVNRYDAVEDNPYPLIFKELDQLIPNSKFILTIREEESWFKSVNRHIGNLRDPMHEWIYGKGKGLPKEDKANTIRVFNEHNKSVLNYFKSRPDDLLVLDFTKGDKWDKLCTFLGHEIPDKKFPHANDASKNKKQSLFKKLNMWKKKIKYGLQIKYIRSRGWL